MEAEALPEPPQPKSDPWEVLKRLGLLRESTPPAAEEPVPIRSKEPVFAPAAETQNWDMPDFEPAVWRPAASEPVVAAQTQPEPQPEPAPELQPSPLLLRQ